MVPPWVVYAKRDANSGHRHRDSTDHEEALVLGVPRQLTERHSMALGRRCVVGTTTGFVRENSLSVFLVMPTPLTGP